MKIKRLLFNVLLISGLGLTSMQAQVSLNIKPTSGTLFSYSLSSIRKLTFTDLGSMLVAKTDGITDSYALNNTRYINFNEVETGILSPQITKSNLNIYPNPVMDIIHIQLNGERPETIKVELISIDGLILYSEKVKNIATVFQIDVSRFNRGIYMCRVNDGKRVEMNKFFKL